MKKIKIVSILLLLVSFITLSGCGEKEESVKEDKTLKIRDLSIDDFKWKINSSACQNGECQLLTFKNNSEYDLIEMELSFTKKSTATEDDMKMFNNFLSSHTDYITENPDNNKIVLKSYYNSEIQKGSEVSDINILLGYDERFWNEYPTNEQVNLMEPSELYIGVIGRDNKLYRVHYNIEDKKWLIDDEKVDLDTKINTKMWQKLSFPKENHHLILSDEENNLLIYFYGISSDSYYEYADKLISDGFKENSYSSIHFTGTNEDGYEVDLNFYEVEAKMYMSITKK